MGEEEKDGEKNIETQEGSRSEKTGGQTTSEDETKANPYETESEAERKKIVYNCVTHKWTKATPCMFCKEPTLAADGRTKGRMYTEGKFKPRPGFNL